MAIWYEVEKSKEGRENFLGCNWDFHDFRIARIEYLPGKDLVEVFLQYDTLKEGVLLRFVDVHDVHINTNNDYAADWICGASVFITEDFDFMWVDDEYWDEQCYNEDKYSKMMYATWVKAGRIIWAVTDTEGNPLELPKDRIDQTWHIYDNIEEKHFDLKEFTDNWDNILRPKYERLT